MSPAAPHPATGLDKPVDGAAEALTPSNESEPTELIFAVVGALGSDHRKIRGMISERLRAYRYSPHEIHISEDIIGPLSGGTIPTSSKYEQAKALIELGNELRELADDNAFLATATVAEIRKRRGSAEGRTSRTAFVVSSLKHPDEVSELRRIYGRGFFLFAIHRTKEKRLEHLMTVGEGMSRQEAQELVDRDEHEDALHGQHMRDTFHLADFFLYDEGIEDKLRYSVERCLDLVFGHPTLTPTFNEFAMYMAFASSLRSADLSRQVGAVIARDRQILSTGANDCPKFAGGLYWPEFTQGHRIEDIPEGRDCVRTAEIDGKKIRGFDSNTIEKAGIIDQVLDDLGLPGDSSYRKKLEEGPIGDITEYGRVVHAEMEALLACARGSTSCAGATLFCTTFPCHNCAKHIIAAGITEVVFVEPYPKSRALDFHPDSAVLEEKIEGRVRFKPFVGVGPRRFFDLFSMSWGAGERIKRKTKSGLVQPWKPKEALPRIKLIPVTYHEFERVAESVIQDFQESSKGTSGGKEQRSDRTEHE